MLLLHHAPPRPVVNGSCPGDMCVVAHHFVGMMTRPRETKCASRKKLSNEMFGFESEMQMHKGGHVSKNGHGRIAPAMTQGFIVQAFGQGPITRTMRRLPGSTKTTRLPWVA